MSVMYMKV